MGMSGVSYDSRPGQKRGGKYLKEGAFRRLKIKKTVSWGSTEQYNLRLWRLCKSKALWQCSGRGSKNPITFVVGVSTNLSRVRLGVQWKISWTKRKKLHTFLFLGENRDKTVFWCSKDRFFCAEIVLLIM